MNFGSSDFAYGAVCGMLFSCVVATVAAALITRAYKRAARRNNA